MAQIGDAFRRSDSRSGFRAMNLIGIPFFSLSSTPTPTLAKGGGRRASTFSRSFRPELWFGRVEGCAGRDGSILIYRREPIGAPRAVFCANAGARLCPAAIGRVTEPVTALLARAACSPCGARTGACFPRRGTGPIPRHDASRFAPLGWTGRAHASTSRIKYQGLFSEGISKPRQLRLLISAAGTPGSRIWRDRRSRACAGSSPCP